MAIQKIEVLCQICPKCDRVIMALNHALKLLDVQVPIMRITDTGEITKSSVGVAKTPIIRINGKVEFAGQIPEVGLLKIRLKEFLMG